MGRSYGADNHRDIWAIRAYRKIFGIPFAGYARCQ